MLDIYDCTGLPGTNHVSRTHNDAAFLGLNVYVSCDAISHDMHFYFYIKFPKYVRGA
jgi:hypothetical protein